MKRYPCVIDGWQVIMPIGRAGGKQERERRQREWDRIYPGWQVVYEVGDRIIPYSDALTRIYDESYYRFLRDNLWLAKRICQKARSLYNPHARLARSGGGGHVDLQTGAVMRALARLQQEFPHEPLTLHGTTELAIGTFGTRQGIRYPMESWDTSPFHVPVYLDGKVVDWPLDEQGTPLTYSRVRGRIAGLSLEKFWQEHKRLAVPIVP